MPREWIARSEYQGHAIKKILCAGERGDKSQEQDIKEAIDSFNRRLQMIAEDCNK